MIIINRCLSGVMRIALVSILVLMGYSATAGDAKTYPGSMGVRYSGPAPVYDHSAIGNPSATAWMYVDLPVLNESNTESIKSSNVRVLDRSYGLDVRCSVNTAYWNSSTGSFYGWWGANKNSSGSGNALQTLNTGAVGGTTFASHSYFSCAIPQTYSGNRSYIVSYYVNED